MSISRGRYDGMRQWHSTALGVVLLCMGSNASAALLRENFEGPQLDERVSLSSVGAFSSVPGWKEFAGFGSERAYGFGRSVCRANCFDSFTASLIVDLGESHYVSSLVFDEIEAGLNWGSGGGLILDGVLWRTSSFDLGRLPYNDVRTDIAPRHHEFSIAREVRKIEIRVRDISDLSEIWLDNLVIETRDATPVPSPGGAGLALATGMALLGAAGLSRRRGRNVVRS